MAKRAKKSTASGIPPSNRKAADIMTAAVSNVLKEPVSFEHGYPANANEVTNARPSIIRGRSKA